MGNSLEEGRMVNARRCPRSRRLVASPAPLVVVILLAIAAVGQLQHLRGQRWVAWHGERWMPSAPRAATEGWARARAARGGTRARGGEVREGVDDCWSEERWMNRSEAV